MEEDRPTGFELFNAAIDGFRRGDFSTAVLFLRGGFFENLYIAPLLLGEQFQAQQIWYRGAQSEPAAAQEYIKRYGRFWEETPESLLFLREIWNDSLVRAELRSFINLSKNVLNAQTDSQRADLLQERELFCSPERLARTQSEILARLERADLRPVVPKPRLALVMLASKDPAASVEFYRSFLEVEPTNTSQVGGGYAEFRFEGVHLAIHGQDRTAAADPYRLGPPPESLGWGAIFVFQVGDFERYYRNALKSRLEIIDSDLSSPGHRYLVFKDPSGYLVEMTEENPRGMDIL